MLNYNDYMNLGPQKQVHTYIQKVTNKILNKNKTKIAICCIAKLENNYIKEFVQYHKKIGIDKIILCDNNDKDAENFDVVLRDYISSGYVIIEDYRGEYRAQVRSYTECYQKYKDKFDWIAFIDIDETIGLQGFDNIHDFLDLPEFKKINCIRLCWKQYTDSGLIYTPNDYSYKRFTKFLPITTPYVSNATKSILRTNLDNLKFNSPHGPLKDKRIKPVNSVGNPCENNIEISNYTWNNAFLNHYRFKTIHEYVMNKMVKGWPTNYGDGGRTMLNLDFFFQFNTYTKEKNDYAMSLIKKYKIPENKKK